MKSMIKMCKWGTDEIVEVTIPAELSYTGKERQKRVAIDACIAPIIKALNAGGVRTDYCCCGHGEKDGAILLHDGRVFRIASTQKVTRHGGFKGFIDSWFVHKGEESDG